MALTQTQIEAYERDGYLVVQDALTASEVAELQDAADRFAQQALNLTEDSDVIELDDAPHLAGGPPLIRRIRSSRSDGVSFVSARTTKNFSSGGIC